MNMQQQMKIKMLEQRLNHTNDLIIRGAIQKRIKQLKLKYRIDTLTGFYWNERIHI